MKVETSLDEFSIRSLDGDRWFIVGRKTQQNWEQRIIRSASGEPVCCIRRNRYPQVEGFSIWSLLTQSGEPELAIDLQDLNRGKKQKVQKMKAGLAMAENIGARSFLNIEGDLKNRMYGISWSEPARKDGPMIAMTWDVCSNSSSQKRSCTNFVLEIPAGVDAVAMVAIAVSICEADAAHLDTGCGPISSNPSLKLPKWEKYFVTKKKQLSVKVYFGGHL